MYVHMYVCMYMYAYRIFAVDFGFSREFFAFCGCLLRSPRRIYCKVSVLFVVKDVRSKRTEAWEARLLASFAAIDVEQSAASAPAAGKRVCSRGLGAVAGWRLKDRLSRAKSGCAENDKNALPAIRNLQPGCEYDIRAQVLVDKVRYFFQGTDDDDDDCAPPTYSKKPSVEADVCSALCALCIRLLPSSFILQEAKRVNVCAAGRVIVLGALSDAMAVKITIFFFYFFITIFRCLGRALSLFFPQKRWT